MKGVGYEEKSLGTSVAFVNMFYRISSHVLYIVVCISERKHPFQPVQLLKAPDGFVDGVVRGTET